MSTEQGGRKPDEPGPRPQQSKGLDSNGMDCLIVDGFDPDTGQDIGTYLDDKGVWRYGSGSPDDPPVQSSWLYRVKKG